MPCTRPSFPEKAVSTTKDSTRGELLMLTSGVVRLGRRGGAGVGGPSQLCGIIDKEESQGPLWHAVARREAE